MHQKRRLQKLRNATATPPTGEHLRRAIIEKEEREDYASILSRASRMPRTKKPCIIHAEAIGRWNVHRAQINAWEALLTKSTAPVKQRPPPPAPRRVRTGNAPPAHNNRVAPPLPVDNEDDHDDSDITDALLEGIQPDGRDRRDTRDQPRVLHLPADDNEDTLEDLADLVVRLSAGPATPPSPGEAFRCGSAVGPPHVAALRGDHILKLLALPAAHIPAIVLLGMVRTTHKEHMRILKEIATMPAALQAGNGIGMGRELFAGMRRNALAAEQGACSWL